MDLTNKLKFYRSAQGKPDQHPRSASLNTLQKHFNGEVAGGHASYLKIVKNYTKEYPPFIQLKLLSKGGLTAPVPLTKCLFFDLETTGLAGGTGTFPFLIGIGFFKDSLFKVEQFFLPDFGREYEVFQYINDILPKFDYLISFNGKSFDLPLLKSRFILNRMSADWDRLQHIDLLHLARRIWKDSLDSLNLGMVEEKLLGRQRSGDIPGALIPQAYFTYLRSGVVHDMVRVIEHNYLDMISMADLILLLAKTEANPALVFDSAALIRLAKLAYEQDNAPYFDLIWEYFEGQEGAIPPRLLQWRSLKAKREKDWSRACALWKELLNQKEYFFFALEELAKYYEHKQGDLHQALVCTQRAIKALEVVEELNPYHPHLAFKTFFLKRMHRLIKKQQAVKKRIMNTGGRLTHKHDAPI
jgi:uncharacterized protein YprB with RNaseH-like and TPR domain